MESINQEFTMEWAGRPLKVEIGKYANQANGAVLVRYGDTVVLSTATASSEPKDLPFFPLTVNYEERLYAVGKIPGGFIKREGRPSEKATLTSRLIDRPLRPLFADGFRNEVQVVSMVMSVDQNCSSEMAAMFGSSLSLCVSDIPFDGPIAGVIVGRVDGEFVINPTEDQAEKSDIDLTVAGTKDAINMVEAGANEVPESVMLDAILHGHEAIKELVAFQEKVAQAVGKEKIDVELFVPEQTIEEEIRSVATDQLKAAIRTHEKLARDEAIDQVKAEINAQYEEKEGYEDKMDQIQDVLQKIVKEEVRKMIVHEHLRPDGRQIDEIRPLSSDVKLLPRTHGSGLFKRGQTQALSVCTLGALGDVQVLDGLDTEESKRFMHHYNFPPFSVGEAKPMRGPGRREIGHGALGERALEPIIPSEKDFPYTIRLVSEVLESNGSTSQASICGSTMAMMDAGVPIKAPVAGIAMGLVKHDDDVAVLTDIQGMEDALGDMDFKVAGTEQGVTALQMDIKISGINRDILETALTQAKEGRMTILSHMAETINGPRNELSDYAPKIMTMSIDPNKIRDVIGPSGKTINKIIEETGVKIDIEQDGSVFIASSDAKMNAQAKQTIEDIVREVEVGEIYTGKVKRIEKFGAFVELFSQKDGLVHISELDKSHVKKVEDVVKLGDEVTVKVIDIDNQGRVKLSRKRALSDDESQEETKSQDNKATESQE
ncbi:polyribonucleotide nucleotidyltransferase [Tuberibacillus sp. Marseille-P3662]|uniref:polyribonucleotide nucleotidyltransferase n=1 Tax=Tuberibacillus sp. Marseille-P3662 TaxID=1965358 RepID=UPI000A1CB3CF|nr:polyribonucleotide nucleotidyltransferase [Tuberibacillus sp. Marseille-P3662]